jgi:hypothetical protein
MGLQFNAASGVSQSSPLAQLMTGRGSRLKSRRFSEAARFAFSKVRTCPSSGAGVGGCPASASSGDHAKRIEFDDMAIARAGLPLRCDHRSAFGPTALRFFRGSLYALVNSKIFQLCSGFQFLPQPDGLRPSSRPSVAQPISIFDGDLAAFERAAPTRPSSFMTKAGKLTLQLFHFAAESGTDIVAQL